MIVGLTYDLRSEYLRDGFTEEETAEFDREETIEAIERTLHINGYETERIGHIKNLVKQLAQDKRWDIVFNIAEGMHGISREAQVPALLEAYNIPYVFSDPLVLSLTLHKALCKRVIRDHNIATPNFAVIDNIQQTERVTLPYPLFAKPVAEGTGKGIDGKSKVNTKEELKEVCALLLEKFKQPVLVETYLPGREFTVGIVGTGENARSMGVLEVELNAKAEPDAYGYVNKENCEELVKYSLLKGDLANSCEKVAIDSWNALGCRDGGRVDIRLDSTGKPNFLEVNPLAGLHPQHSDLPILSKLNNIVYNELMKMIMDSAILRLKKG